MTSAEAREYVRLATTETKGRTKMACDLLIAESIKLQKIKQIINTAKAYRPRIDSEDIQAICEVLENK